MKKINCLGIFREDDHSPDRVSDDHAILEAVASNISADKRFQVTTLRPGDLSRETLEEHRPDVIFYMCEESEQLDLIASSEAPVIINSVKGVRNTFRDNIFRIFSEEPFFPESLMITTSNARIPAQMSMDVWVKRGDYHAVERADVQFAGTHEQLDTILEEFRTRGIGKVMLQRDIPGDLIKFYGISDRWFHWFYHKAQVLNEYTFDKEELQEMCRKASRLVDVEIYGGDAIISPDGTISIIDLNAWPSFALFRQEAAGHIAAHIISRTDKEVKHE